MTSARLSLPRKPLRAPSAFVVVGYICAGLYALVILIPLYFVVISAFKDNALVITAPLALPTGLDFHKFFQAQDSVNLLHGVLISIIVTLGAELVTLVLAFPAAYAVARLPTRLAPVTEGTFSLGFLIPGLAILMPVYLMTAKAGLLYNPLALILVYPAFNLPLAIILLSSFMRKLPRELEESAVMDGGNVLQIMYYIFFPICLPGVVTVLVLNFINIWNEYLFALILMDSDNRTAQLALALLRANQRSIDYGLIAAGVVILFQDRIMSGLLTGAVKE